MTDTEIEGGAMERRTNQHNVHIHNTTKQTIFGTLDRAQTGHVRHIHTELIEIVLYAVVISQGAHTKPLCSFLASNSIRSPPHRRPCGGRSGRRRGDLRHCWCSKNMKTGSAPSVEPRPGSQDRDRERERERAVSIAITHRRRPAKAPCGWEHERPSTTLPGD